MIRRTKPVIAAATAVSIFLLIAGSQAQPAAPLSQVRVTFVDQIGAVIGDGEVVFKSASKTIVSRTGNDGSVTVTLASGRYTLTATSRGFLKNEVPDFQVVAPEPNELKIVLKIDPTPVCGPCVGEVALVPTVTTDLPNVITSEPSRESPAQPAAKKIRSPRCLYLWKCSAS